MGNLSVEGRSIGDAFFRFEVVRVLQEQGRLGSVACDLTRQGLDKTLLILEPEMAIESTQKWYLIC